jgi:short-subunit dehydrogenase
MTRPLAGRLALVTGASSGIGRAVAVELAAAGARLVLVSRSEARLRAAAGAVAAAGDAGRPPLLVAADVADAEAVRRLAREVEATAGRSPDLVVSNAGIGHFGPVATLPLPRFRAILEVNLLGAVHCTQAFLPAMLRRRQGTLVFVSSGLGVLPFPGSAAYCASKHALNGFAGALRAEVESQGLKVLLVLPGGTRTPFFEANAYPPEVLSRYLFQRLTSPERVARAVVRAVVRGRRRVVIGPLNDVGLRLAGAVPGLAATFLTRAGRRLAARDPGWAGPPPAGQ